MRIGLIVCIFRSGASGLRPPWNLLGLPFLLALWCGVWSAGCAWFVGFRRLMVCCGGHMRQAFCMAQVSRYGSLCLFCWCRWLLACGSSVSCVDRCPCMVCRVYTELCGSQPRCGKDFVCPCLCRWRRLSCLF